MQVIKDWFNSGKNYDAGVSLYMQYGDNAQLKDLFTEFRTPFKEKKLVEVLRGLISVSAEATHTAEKKVTQLVAETHGWPDAMSAELMALKEVWKPLYAEQMNLNARLYDVARLGVDDKNKEQEAGQMAHRILNLRDQIKDIYFQRDYYLENNVFPGKEQVFKPVVTDIKIAERRLTVRRYLTRLKKELAAQAKPHIRLKQEKKWTEYVAEMHYINEKLNRPYGEGIPSKA